MSLLKSPESKTADQTQVFEGRIRAGAAVIDSDPNTRLWRDEYLPARRNVLIDEALAMVLEATTLPEFFKAQAKLLAAQENSDMREHLIRMAKPAPETTP